VTNAPNAQESLIEEKKYTPEELGDIFNFHPTTVRRMFLDEPGVLRYGHGTLRGKRQHFTLRIPASVAERVFRRMTVGSAARA
jgi:hypothetical protein